MIQGCGSNVGKSMLVAGLCRAYTNRGLKVAPFKPQNMSNNAAVTDDGGEIGRAQALQALAARMPTTVHMNPVLLKPETDKGSQVILQGKRLQHATARDYFQLKPKLIKGVIDSFTRLSATADLVIVEGAGSPAEVNLRKGDIANMGFAQATETPVILTGDIDRGGVIAQLVGTQAVIDPADASLVKGFLINKFRGDTSLFDDGYKLIEDRTGWRGFGVVPWFTEAYKLPAEDSSDIGAKPLTQEGKPAPDSGKTLKIVCLQLSRIANFDDLDPLSAEPNVTALMLSPGQAIPGDADLVIIPGSKSTRGDLAYLRAQGWDIDLIAHHRRGGRILGLCGGYQMLGHAIHDPQGIEGTAGTSEGLGLLDVETEMTPQKSLTQVTATDLITGEPVSGYEIHIGQTTGPARAHPMFTVNGVPEGAQSAEGRVQGTYLHGLFTQDTYRASVLTRLGSTSTAHYGAEVEATLNTLATHIETHIDVDGLLKLAQQAT
jgi:adenosylcobyric acid synthase